MNLVRELGLLNACIYVLDRILGVLFGGRVRLHKYYFMAQPVATKPWLASHRGKAVEVRRLNEGDQALDELPRPKSAIKQRYEQGAICLGAFKSGAFIGCLWLTLGPYQEDEVRCRYLPAPEGRAVWDFDVYVHPSHRSSFAFLRLWDEANALLGALGVEWSLSRISAFNPSSMHAHSRMAARTLGSALFLKIGPWQVSYSTREPHLTLSRTVGSVPSFRLDAESQVPS